jgi:hypothetical protein
MAEAPKFAAKDIPFALGTLIKIARIYLLRCRNYYNSFDSRCVASLTTFSTVTMLGMGSKSQQCGACKLPLLY